MKQIKIHGHTTGQLLAWVEDTISIKNCRIVDNNYIHRLYHWIQSLLKIVEYVELYINQ